MQFVFFLLMQPYGVPLLYFGMVLASFAMFASKQTAQVQTI
jgi:hypothetical protein